MSKENWRSPGAYAYAAQLDSHDMAWEFLRRNHAFKAEYGSVTANGDRGADQAARRWGLRFPG
jgi:Family of unknown function (DUF6499)